MNERRYVLAAYVSGLALLWGYWLWLWLINRLNRDSR
jgi:hypothetical protein